MFSRFTEKAIQAIMLAQEEAKRFQHSYVGSEHILLGILGEGDNVVIKVFQELGISAEKVKASVEERLEYGTLATGFGNIPFTQQAKQILTYAWDEARKLGHNYVNVEHLFLSIFRDSTSIAARVLSETGINLTVFKETLFKLLGNRYAVAPQKHKSVAPTPTLDLFGRDLTWLAHEGSLDPVIGREKEIDRIIQILSRRTKNNPVLTGAPGVGKTAIVEGLAQKICKGTIPDKLLEKRVVCLDLGLLIAGTKYRGEFEDRVKKVMEEVKKAKNVILFIDELHTIIGTGGSEGSLDIANLFKPALARGELQCIGATTHDEYRKHIEGDGALERRFQSVLVEEPTVDETLNILKGIKKQYEEFHKVEFTDESLRAAVDLSSRYITDRHLPDKAVDLIDEAASKVMLAATSIPKEILDKQREKEKISKEIELANAKKDKEVAMLLKKKEKELFKQIQKYPADQIKYIEKVVTEGAIAETVSSWTGVPVTKLSEEESSRLLKMEEEIGAKVVGQEEAIKALARAVKRSKVGLKDPKRPTGSFMFLGPTGVGKTELAKRLAEFLFGNVDAVIRVDMSEYMEKHTVSRLIGSPPGYVGYNEGGQLTEPVRRKPYSVVLFDELEKAAPEIINILLQILEDGMLTDANGRTINFKNTIIVMTSNVGSKFIEKETSFGFVDAARQEEHKFSSMKEKLKEELKKEFKPEFLNRIDDVVIFKTLSKKDIRGIVTIMLGEVIERLKNNQIHITVENNIYDFLTEKGFNPKQGARPLRRAIQEYFEDALSDRLLSEKHREDIDIVAKVKGEEIDFDITKREEPKKQKAATKKPRKNKKIKQLIPSG
jgi:ATP-dependent Clp protease ATP-binding subunit ClpC